MRPLNALEPGYAVKTCKLSSLSSTVFCPAMMLVAASALILFWLVSFRNKFSLLSIVCMQPSHLLILCCHAGQWKWSVCYRLSDISTLLQESVLHDQRKDGSRVYVAGCFQINHGTAGKSTVFVLSVLLLSPLLIHLSLGTEKQAVADDYYLQLFKATMAVDELCGNLLGSLAKGSAQGAPELFKVNSSSLFRVGFSLYLQKKAVLLFACALFLPANTHILHSNRDVQLQSYFNPFREECL